MVFHRIYDEGLKVVKAHRGDCRVTTLVFLVPSLRWVGQALPLKVSRSPAVLVRDCSGELAYRASVEALRSPIAEGAFECTEGGVEEPEVPHMRTRDASARWGTGTCATFRRRRCVRGCGSQPPLGGGPCRAQWHRPGCRMVGDAFLDVNIGLDASSVVTVRDETGELVWSHTGG